MRGLMRLLMMFGPMIFNQYQRYQRSKQRNASLPGRNDRGYDNRQYDNRDRRYDDRQHNDNRRSNRSQQPQRRDPRDQRGDYIEYRDLNKDHRNKGRVPISEDEQNFNLSEDDIMLSKEDLKHYQDTQDLSVEGDITKAPGEEAPNQKATAPKPNKDDLDMEDLFLKE